MLHDESNRRVMREASACQVVSTLMIPSNESKHRSFWPYGSSINHREETLMEIDQGTGVCTNSDCNCSVEGSTAYCCDACRRGVDKGTKVENEVGSACA